MDGNITLVAYEVWLLEKAEQFKLQGKSDLFEALQIMKLLKKIAEIVSKLPIEKIKGDGFMKITLEALEQIEV